MEIRLGTGRPVEVDERGRPVNPDTVATRGRLVVGRRLIAERKRDAAAKRPHRKLGLEELRCLNAVEGEDLKASRAR